MMVSNSSALWSARAWLQSSRILSSSRRFGTLTAEPFYPQIGAVCDTAHTVFLGGWGAAPFVLEGGDSAVATGVGFLGGSYSGLVQRGNCRACARLGRPRAAVPTKARMSLRGRLLLR